MNWNGLLQRPKLHLGFGKRLGVARSRPRQISPYAAADGTPAAEINDVKAVLDGRMVQVTRAATAQTTMTALRGWPADETRETHPEKGRTPSRATAKTRRDDATMAIAVFWRYDQFLVLAMREKIDTYKPESDDADDVHEDMPTLAQDSSIQRDERLRCLIAEESVRPRLNFYQSASV